MIAYSKRYIDTSFSNGAQVCIVFGCAVGLLITNLCWFY